MGESSYEADLNMTGARQREMKLRMTFSQISFTEPCKLLFDPAEDGMPKSQGCVRYNGVEMNVEDMLE